MKEIAQLRSKLNSLAVKSNPASTLDTESGKTMFRLVQGMAVVALHPWPALACGTSSTHGIRNGDSSTPKKEAPTASVPSINVP